MWTEAIDLLASSTSERKRGEDGGGVGKPESVERTTRGFVGVLSTSIYSRRSSGSGDARDSTEGAVADPRERAGDAEGRREDIRDMEAEGPKDMSVHGQCACFAT